MKFKPGASFSDFVVSDMMTKRDKRLDVKPKRDFRLGSIVWIGGILSLLLLWVRLFSLQVISYERYKILSDENRLRLVKLVAPRGEILDRNGVVLAGNEKIYVDENGLKIESYKRIYPEKDNFAHVLGNIGEISGKELGLLVNGSKYTNADMIGRNGLEAYYENLLRGKNGGWLLEVDSSGKMVRDLGRTAPLAGKNLQTTLDLELGRVATEALGEKKGAVVVSSPKNGDVMVLVSSPTYDANKLIENFEQLNNDKNLPMFNRSISAVYPPGSVFKMPVTIAAIDSQQVKPGFMWNDEGYIQIGSYRYNNWLYTKHGGVEGLVGFSQAITRSTDTFFYKIGEFLGPELLGSYAKKFGFGELTGIDLPSEEKGLVPSKEWKKEAKNEQWFLGNSFHFAIGQDDLLVTPLQVNVMTNILATEGTRCIPHLVQIPNNNQCSEIQISQTALEIVKKGMIGACSTGGTAFVFFDWNADKNKPLVACKTGTAEYVAEDGKMRTHGWLTAYAPVENPEISVTVVMEGGGEGSNVAAPVVRKILAKYFKVDDKYPYDRIPQEVGE